MVHSRVGAEKAQMNLDHLEVPESKDKHKLKQKNKSQNKTQWEDIRRTQKSTWTSLPTVGKIRNTK